LYGIGDTVGAFRQSEVVELDVCDWLTGKELFGAMAYTKRPENETMGAGQIARFSTGGELYLVRRMSDYMRTAKLTVYQECAKWKGKSVRRTPCNLCGHLFPLVPGGERAAQPGVAQLSKSTISKVITTLLLQAELMMSDSLQNL